MYELLFSLMPKNVFTQTKYHVSLCNKTMKCSIVDNFHTIYKCKIKKNLNRYHSIFNKNDKHNIILSSEELNNNNNNNTIINAHYFFG